MKVICFPVAYKIYHLPDKMAIIKRHINLLNVANEAGHFAEKQQKDGQSDKIILSLPVVMPYLNK